MFSKPRAFCLNLPLIDYSENLQLAPLIALPGMFESISCELDLSEIRTISCRSLLQLPDLGGDSSQVAPPFVLSSSEFRHPGEW